MPTQERTGWILYLRVVLAVLAVASLVLAVVPLAGERAFALLVYQDTEWPADFSQEARSYIRLTNAVLGAVMAGWFVTMLLIVDQITRVRSIWIAITVGLGVWFVPDSIYSLVSGYWENAVLNLLILATFIPALVYPLTSRSRSAHRLPARVGSRQREPGPSGRFGPDVN